MNALVGIGPHGLFLKILDFESVSVFEKNIVNTTHRIELVSKMPIEDCINLELYDEERVNNVHLRVNNEAVGCMGLINFAYKDNTMTIWFKDLTDDGFPIIVL